MGNRIEQLRLARGWSQKDLAERMGTTQQTVGRLENEKRRLRKDWLEKFADALEVTIEDLLDDPKRTIKAPDISPVDDETVGSIALALATRGLRVYRVDADSVAESGILPGSLITLDETAQSIESARTGDIVAVESGLGDKRTLLRVLVRPCLVTTNRPNRNSVFRIDNPAMDAKLIGVVVRE